MEKYIFACIGTSQLIEDSFGPRVGEILEKELKQNENIKILGTMNYLRNLPGKLIVIDSALGEEKLIGNTYMNRGGIEIGKAFGRSLYFPAQWNIKTIVGKRAKQLQEEKATYQINQLAQRLATQIVNVMQ